MKKFYSLFLTTLLVFGLTDLQAQDKNNPWQFSFGTNAVDVEADSETQFADFFDVDENWNTAKSPISMFTISKYLGDNLSFGVGASFNSISKYATGSPDGSESDMSTFSRPGVTNDYFNVDAMLKYDLSDALPIRVLGMDFEPFVGVGPGWTWFDDYRFPSSLGRVPFSIVPQHHRTARPEVGCCRDFQSACWNRTRSWSCPAGYVRLPGLHLGP